MYILSWIGFAAGIAVLLLTAGSVLGTLVVPRATAPRLTVWVTWAVRWVFLTITDRVDSYKSRDRILALNGPALLGALLLAWVTLVFLGYAFLFWPLTGDDFGRALIATGSGMFTLGFATPNGAAPIALSFFAAMSGLVILALQIAYLPALYAAFNRRETLVTMLAFLGGAPAWGPEVLMRQELIDNIERLAWFYESWTEWAADVSESHTTYPQLIYFRSPKPLRSWVIGLLAVLDAAALHLSLSPVSAPASARPLMRMGYVAFRDIADVLGLPSNPDPHPDDPIQLTEAEFRDAVARLRQVGWKVERDEAEAWKHFRGWRVNYESAAYGLALHLDAPPALWTGPRRKGRDQVIRPERPPHRAPVGDEKAKLLAVRERRREARRATEAEHAALQHRHEPEAAPVADEGTL